MRFVRRVLNRSFDAMFTGPLLDAAWVRRLHGKAICLCYHRVDDPRNHAFLTETGYPAIPPAELKTDIHFLKKSGFDFITFEDIRNGKMDPHRPHVVITFDDCFKDNYTHGLRVLDETGVRGVFFQVTGMVDAERFLWEQAVFWYCHDPRRASRFAALARRVLPADAFLAKNEGFSVAFRLVEEVPMDRANKVLDAAREELSWDDEHRIVSEIYPTRQDLQTARRAGHEIGSHGDQHYKRVNVTAEAFENDLAVSVGKIRAWTGAAPLSYAYPHGNFVSGDSVICAKYFRYIATVRQGFIEPLTDPLEIPRFYWPGPLKNFIRRKRWLLTGRF